MREEQARWTRPGAERTERWRVWLEGERECWARNGLEGWALAQTARDAVEKARRGAGAASQKGGLSQSHSRDALRGPHRPTK